MAVKTFEEFLKKPLALDERYPTKAELLLAVNHFFELLGTNDYYQELRETIVNNKKSIKPLNWDEFKIYFLFFNFGDLEREKIWWSYCDAIQDLPICYQKKNDYLLYIMMNTFIQRWHLEKTGKHWFEKTPDADKPFSSYIKDKIAPKLNTDDSVLKDKYRKWLSNDATPTIDGLVDFWNSIENSVKDDIVPQREILFAYWFWQKMREDFGQKDFNVRDPYEKDDSGNKIDELNRLLDSPKTEESFKQAEALLIQLKETSNPSQYPAILLSQFLHLLYQRKYKESLPFLEIISQMLFVFFFSSDDDRERCFTNILSCIAHIYKNGNTDKETKRRLKSLFKQLFEDGINFSYIEPTPLSKNEKENVDANLCCWSRKFEECFPSTLFYSNANKHKLPELVPRPNKKEPDRVLINFGECRNTPQIVFYSRINDLVAVEELLKNKKMQITKIGEQNDSALFWALQNMSVMNPLAFAQQTIFPPTLINQKSKKVLNFLAEYYKDSMQNEDAYLDVFQKQRQTSRKIFDKIISRHLEQKNSLREKSFDDFETSLGKVDVGNESILMLAIYSADYEVVRKVIDLYTEFVFNPNKINEWINAKAGYPPSPAIYHLVRLISEKSHIHFHNAYPYSGLNKPVSDDIHAEYQFLLYPTTAASIPEKIKEIQHNRAMSAGIIPIMRKYGGVVRDELIKEDEIVRILTLLLKYGADPLIEVDMEHSDNGPKSYNAIKFAAEIGWQNGLQIMYEHVKTMVPITQEMLDEWLNIAVGWENIWLTKLKDVPHNNVNAKKCHEVVDYLKNLQPSVPSPVV